MGEDVHLRLGKLPPAFENLVGGCRLFLTHDLDEVEAPRFDLIGNLFGVDRSTMADGLANPADRSLLSAQSDR